MNKLNRETFFAYAKKVLFKGGFDNSKGALQKQGLNILIDEWEKRPDVTLDEFAYILATAYHETAFTMQPVKEYGGTAYLKKKKYWPYVGRGYVQLTWDYNYKKASEKLGVDFVANPNLAMNPKHAARILFEGMKEGWFTNKDVDDYIDSVNEGDEIDQKEYENARRVVNGVDKKVAIAEYAIEFRKCVYAGQVVNVEPIINDTKTLGGAGATGVGGLVILAEPVKSLADAVEGQTEAFTSGDIIKLIIGLVIVAGALFVLYSRWDDAGRPKFWK